MHYPFWFVPGLTSPMLIAVIAVLHIYVSLYAVGGGIFLARETTFAYRTNNREYLTYLRGHAWFFILITVVYGAITGVGIWWTIGLASPLPTEMLIHTFVFAWGMEYAFFLVEPADQDAADENRRGAVLLDYSRGGNRSGNVAQILRDYLVQVTPGSDDLLLGKAYFVVAGRRLASSYFLIERYRPLPDAEALAARVRLPTITLPTPRQAPVIGEL